MAISDTDVPYSDGWWLAKLFAQLRVQSRECELLMDRYEGNPPLPTLSQPQQEAVRWYLKMTNRNLERMIVNGVLSRMGIVGLRTAVEEDKDEGDPVAFTTWKKARMKQVMLQAIDWMLAMRRSYVIVGKDTRGGLLVTAEDPRFMTAIVDPTDPTRTLAALKVMHNSITDEDLAYLYLAGTTDQPPRLMVATKARKARVVDTTAIQFSARAWDWDQAIVSAGGEIIQESRSGAIPWLTETDVVGNIIGGPCPVVELVNVNAQAQFEPYLASIDRIHYQILQRMTIATAQAFKQRAFKGLPKQDPVTGEVIDWNSVLVNDPAAIWSIPLGVEIQELGQAVLTDISQAIKDDVQAVCAESGTPLYVVTPDAANGSAEGASLQRETNIFMVQTRRDVTELRIEMIGELMFATIGDTARSQPGTVEAIWGPIERNSIASKANAIAQTKGVMSRMAQLTDIWGYSPTQAARVISELEGDFLLDEQYANVSAANLPPTVAPPVNTGP